MSKEFLAGEKKRDDILISDAQFYQKQGITLFRDFHVQKVDFKRRMRIEHWDNAVEQGRMAMRNMMEKFQSFIHVPYFFSDESDLSYEYWGDAKGHDEVVHRGDMAKKPT